MLCRTRTWLPRRLGDQAISRLSRRSGRPHTCLLRSYPVDLSADGSEGRWPPQLPVSRSPAAAAASFCLPCRQHLPFFVSHFDWHSLHFYNSPPSLAPCPQTPPDSRLAAPTNHPYAASQPARRGGRQGRKKRENPNKREKRRRTEIEDRDESRGDGKKGGVYISELTRRFSALRCVSWDLLEFLLLSCPLLLSDFARVVVESLHGREANLGIRFASSHRSTLS
ncbi:hypothetical protein VTK73DRAFT_4270 [Phialemonium thermophilum]|uniref:Uncharacterized protein n=1 Tax=Phialemonium thermophilum TaxID=223376 RepID=A0ABR3VA19_9PEZI